MTTDSTPAADKSRLFTASCFSLISTSVCFAVVGASLGAFKNEFLLSNTDVGWIGGAAIWGFTVSMIILGPLCDAIGLKNLLRFAFFCHLAGALTMITASGYEMLFAGSLILALGNGTVEAACNPLVATLYPNDKTEKLNHFHVWFPGGIVIGGVLSFLLGEIAASSGIEWLGDWRTKIALIIIPTLIYGWLFLGQSFPPTERKAAGITFSGMLKGAFSRPLFWILLFCMAITASLELGPGRWIPAVLEAGGIHGILVLAYINGLMAVLRFNAGAFLKRFSPIAILMVSSVLAGAGLYWFSFSESTVSAFASATLFALGVCFFWPTMLGITAELVPKSGSLGLALMGGIGMLTVGVITSPAVGKIADGYFNAKLEQDHQEETVSLLREVQMKYPRLAQEAPEVRKEEILSAVTLANETLKSYTKEGTLPEPTAVTLRSAIQNAPEGFDTSELSELVNSADNYGGRIAFRYLAPFAVIIFSIFLTLHFANRKQGGYKTETV
ncbi:MAG: MFS transporter [Verrucomicrobiota bacterium]